MFLNKKQWMEKLFIDENKLLLTRELGSGSYGTVWAGECLKKPVAIKLLKGETGKASDISVEKFKQLQKEVRRMTESLHENIILAMGLSIYQDQLAIVMELLDGDLDRLLVEHELRSPVGAGVHFSDERPKGSPRLAKRASKKKDYFSLYRRLLMAKDAALGMNWLHSRDPAIIHRDLKLANLMYKKIGDNYVIKVADFGLAVVKPSHKKYLTGKKRGTPLTMAPEVMKEQPYSQKADVYSFGLCLWQIVTCQPLFPDISDLKPSHFQKSICKGQRPEIPSFVEQSYPELSELMTACWSGDPKHRPDFLNIILALDEILVDVAIADTYGREFWKANFMSEKEDIPWDNFWERLSDYLGFTRKEYLRDLAELCFKVLIQDCHKDKKTESVNIECFGNFLKWYGPMDPKGEGDRRPSVNEEGEALYIDADRRTEYSMVYRLEKLLRSAWFHGLIENDEAIRRLEDKDPDTFLVRCSGTIPGQFAITRTVDESYAPIQSTRLSQSRYGFGESANNSHSSSGNIVIPHPAVDNSSNNSNNNDNNDNNSNNTTNRGGRGGGLRDSSEIIQMKKFASLPQLIEAIVEELAWKHCPGSPFAAIWAEIDKEDNSEESDNYQPLPSCSRLITVIRKSKTHSNNETH